MRNGVNTVVSTNKYGYVNEYSYYQEERGNIFTPCKSRKFVILNNDVNRILHEMKRMANELEIRQVSLGNFYEAEYTINSLCEKDASMSEILDVKKEFISYYNEIMQKVDKCSDCIVKGRRYFCKENMPENLGCELKIREDGVSCSNITVAFVAHLHEDATMEWSESNWWYLVEVDIQNWKPLGSRKAMVSDKEIVLSSRQGFDFHLYRKMVVDHFPTDEECMVFVQKHMSEIKFPH